MRASPTHFQVNLCLNPNSIRKRYPHLVFCIAALKVDLEDHFLEFECMTLQFYARSHALICARSKTAFAAPHSTSSPHLAQTERVRLTRFFFALPDSNTSPRVTISVLGRVVVSQMGIVHVPLRPLNMFAPLCSHMCLYRCKCHARMP